MTRRPMTLPAQGICNLPPFSELLKAPGIIPSNGIGRQYELPPIPDINARSSRAEPSVLPGYGESDFAPGHLRFAHLEIDDRYAPPTAANASYSSERRWDYPIEGVKYHHQKMGELPTCQEAVLGSSAFPSTIQIPGSSNARSLSNASLVGSNSTMSVSSTCVDQTRFLGVQIASPSNQKEAQKKKEHKDAEKERRRVLKGLVDELEFLIPPHPESVIPPDTKTSRQNDGKIARVPVISDSIAYIHALENKLTETSQVNSLLEQDLSDSYAYIYALERALVESFQDDQTCAQKLLKLREQTGVSKSTPARPNSLVLKQSLHAENEHGRMSSGTEHYADFNVSRDTIQYYRNRDEAIRSKIASRIAAKDSSRMMSINLDQVVKRTTIKATKSTRSKKGNAGEDYAEFTRDRQPFELAWLGGPNGVIARWESIVSYRVEFQPFIMKPRLASDDELSDSSEGPLKAKRKRRVL